MNARLFKKLIKEAVIEAIQEELPFVLEEHLAKQEKKVLRENKTFSYTSNDVIPGNPDIRASLRTKMGEQFGFNQPQQYQPSMPLEVIHDQVDESTGEPINPYLAFLADSAANMTPQERAGLKNLG
jgi:hypothetical protein